MQSNDGASQEPDSLRSEVELRNQVALSYSQWFLPLPLSRRELARLQEIGSVLPTWVGQLDKPLLFMPPPPPVKVDPHARPQRLSETNKRLKELRALTLKEKEDLALRVIDRVLSNTREAAVAFSGGRDSLVALHLTRQRWPDVQVVFINTGIEFPETVTYVRDLSTKWDLNLHVPKPKRNFWRLARERGLPIGGRGNGYFLKELSVAADVKLSNACCNQLKITPARQFYADMGTEAVITGLRCEESLMRRLNFADYGALRWSRDYGTLNAWPLFAWSQADVQAYIKAYDLPLNPIYDMGHQRVGCWACMQDFLRGDSRLFALAKTHPGMYATLKAQFGDEMLRVLAAWGNIDHREWTMEHFDGLYKPCTIELLKPTARRMTGRQQPAQTAHADEVQSTGHS